MGIVILTLFFTASVFLFYHFYPNYINLKRFFFLLLMFILVNSSIHLILVQILEKRPKQFNHIYLILITIKILLYLLFLIIFIFKLKTGIKSFLISFLVLYAGYTIFETIFLSKYVKNNGVKLS